MSLKPQPPRHMPPEMAAWDAKHLAADDPYKLIGDTLYDYFHHEDFADLYHREGKLGRVHEIASLTSIGISSSCSEALS